jgi:hypothetical protein
MILAREVPVSFDVAGGAVVRAGPMQSHNPGIAPRSNHYQFNHNRYRHVTTFQ